MKKIIALLPIMALSTAAQADTAYGALGNFDVVNDTLQTCNGFEIEIDDARTTQIGGTYSFNHYGTPKIREDLTDPLHPKVFVTYRATVPSGTTTGFTNYAPPGTISPTQGHQCTNPSVNLGCEHFGVGIYSTAYTAVKYNWLDANGQPFPAGVVHVATPVWTGYQPMQGVPAVLKPNPVVNQPPIVVQPAVVQFPAQVAPMIPAPPVVIPPANQFGDPSWVKVIKTTTHNTDHVPLEDLVGDKDGDNNPLWANGEPAEIESEWYLLQTNNGANPNKSELAAKNPDHMGDGREVVTRRYEFYAYAAGDSSIDGENGEAMCDEVAIGSLKGVGTVTVAEAGGTEHDFVCSGVDVVGDYQGSQMGEFNAVAPFSIISYIQSGNVGEAFPQRKVLIGGDTPYETTTSGNLPNGLAIDSETGILSGTPAKVGTFPFNVAATDNFGSKVSRDYTLNVTGPGDVNTDFKIDSTDVNTIKARYGEVVLAGAKDPADVNGDLKINLLDYRKAASLCTKPRCAP